MLVKSVETLLVSLGELDEHASVLADAARVLAKEADLAEYSEKPKSAAGAVRELRATLAELRQKVGAGDGDDGVGWDFAGVGPAEVRNTS